MIRSFLPLVLLALTSLISGCGGHGSNADATPSATAEVAAPRGVETAETAVPVEQGDVRVILHTSKGAIEVILYATKTPVTVANFLNLAQRGYYDDLTFHRVIPNFMIQGGDPEGTGRGGPGYQFEDEFSRVLRHDGPGVLSMANAGPGTNGSQFFITHVATPWLDRRHTIFGRVIKGQDVVDAIRKGDTIEGIEILDSADILFQEQAKRLQQWDAVLDARGN